jgi:hypothetical protein
MKNIRSSTEERKRGETMVIKSISVETRRIRSEVDEDTV